MHIQNGLKTEQNIALFYFETQVDCAAIFSFQFE